MPVSWLNHPRYRPLRDSLIERLRSPTYRFRRLDPIIFLCGGSGSLHRDTLRDYLRARHPDLLVFYAESVWLEIARRPDLSALEMEAYLARLADVVMVVVESPGTFAELGAFSMSEELRGKLLPILDVAYRHRDDSFIVSGPVRWIDATSAYRPVIWVPLSRILEAGNELIERLGRLPKPKSTRLTNLGDSPKHLLFFLCDLIAVTQPVTLDVLRHYTEAIVSASAAAAVESLIGLALANEAGDKFRGRPRHAFLQAVNS